MPANGRSGRVLGHQHLLEPICGPVGDRREAPAKVEDCGRDGEARCEAALLEVVAMTEMHDATPRRDAAEDDRLERKGPDLAQQELFIRKIEESFEVPVAIGWLAGAERSWSHADTMATFAPDGAM